MYLYCEEEEFGVILGWCDESKFMLRTHRYLLRVFFARGAEAGASKVDK